VKRVVAVGGGTKSKTWLQIVSDVTGIGQVVPALTIGASYGDAFLAGLAAGILDREDINHWVKNASMISPNSQLYPAYDEYYSDYLELYTKTKDIIHRLSGRGGM
jgi:xylulokinase